MRHTMRMFLVPEDLFNSVINSSTTPADGTALGLVRQRLHQIERNRNMDENERLANYHQEFKRLNKIVREQEERPMDNEDDDDGEDDEWGRNSAEKEDQTMRQQQQQPSSSAFPYKLRSGSAAEEKKKRTILDHLYKDINSPVSYTSMVPLLNEARKTNSSIKRRDVEEYLAEQPSYTLHRQAIRRFKRLPTLASGLHTDWQADLAVFDRLAPQNKGFRYLLVCVDTLSRQLFVEPVKSKKSEDMVHAFDRLFTHSKYIPWKLVTDQGLEFTAKRMQTYFDSKNVKHFLHERLFRYFTARQTQRWLDVIQDIVNGINHSYNSSIQMRPVDVTFRNADTLREKLANEAAMSRPKRLPRFHVGDLVRIEKHKHVFQKGYVGRFTSEIFKVDSADEGRSPVTYRIRDADDELIKGRFYAADLCRVRKNTHQDGNRTNSFRVRLPRKIQFNSEWDVGLATIIYPHSWPSLGTTEDQFIELEWKTGNVVTIPVPSSNIIRPYELSKSLYSLLDISSEHLSNQVHDAQQSYKRAMNAARKQAQREYLNMKSDLDRARPKRSKISAGDDAIPLLTSLLTGRQILCLTADALLDREKRAATSNVPLRRDSDSDEEYQKKLDNYFMKIRDTDDLQLYRELVAKHLELELNKLTKDQLSLNNSIKDLGMDAWIQAYRKVEWSTFPFQNSSSSSELVFFNQYGGAGVGTYNIFYGQPYQRGNGIGAVFRSLMRYLVPIGKEIGATIGRQGLESGNRVLSNVLEGKDLKESLISEGKVGLKNLLEKAANNVQTQKGKGFDFKRYVKPEEEDAFKKRIGVMKKGNKSRKKDINKLQSSIGPPQLLPAPSSESPYLFRLYSDNLWCDLSRIYLHLELSIEKNKDDNWVEISSVDELLVGAIQGVGQTFTQQLKVSHDSEKDKGFKERCSQFEGGKKAQFFSRLDFDLGNQELYLLNNLDLLFSIYKAKDSFLIHTLKDKDTQEYRLRVHDVKIYAKMAEVQPSLNMNIHKMLEKQPATYAVRKTEVKSTYISGGRYEVEYNVFSSTIPRRVTIGLVEYGALNGNPKLSLSTSSTYIREIAVQAGGFIYPMVPYKLAFKKEAFMRAYVDLYEALGMANSDRSCDITRQQFKNGWTLFVIPLTSTLDDSVGYELLRSGTTTIRASFNTAIPGGGVEMIVLGEFDQMIMIDYNRDIVSDSKLG
ncbi:hypothetical protein niasHT_018863 [Heterodera trifolii]|uniref:Integrase catalytic domain-containing protein n=1 Tax=Heterodera trifolii TaxID=157864 RepID=A0ABD2KYL9_9BILA